MFGTVKILLIFLFNFGILSGSRGYSQVLSAQRRNQNRAFQQGFIRYMALREEIDNGVKCPCMRQLLLCKYALRVGVVEQGVLVFERLHGLPDIMQLFLLRVRIA